MPKLTGAFRAANNEVALVLDTPEGDRLAFIPRGSTLMFQVNPDSGKVHRLTAVHAGKVLLSCDTTPRGVEALEAL